jgi:pseudouridine synthase
MCGLGSRRSCERYVRGRKVSVNDVTVTDLSFKIDPDLDTVALDGKPVRPAEKEFYLLLNKPRGYVVSRDAQGGKSVFQLLKGFPKNLQYAGRLDADSEGLLFLTTNGEMIQRLTHPSHQASKIYLATLDRKLEEKDMAAFRNGLPLEEGPTLPAQIDLIREIPPGYRVILREGRNRQIRRMMEALGRRVCRLTRVAFGPLNLGKLKSGDYRPLTKNEIWKLKRNLRLKDPGPVLCSGSRE